MEHSLGRILLAEDHPDVRDTLASLLKDHGYTVVPVGTAEEGMALLESGPSFDLLISDHSLPGQTGAWLAQQAISRRLIDRERTLIVTALPDPSGCEGLTVLPKPLDVAHFLAQVALKIPNDPIPPPQPPEANPQTRVELAFYMSSGSAHSHRALQSLEGVLREFDPAGFRLEVCDLSQGSHEAARRDKVSYTPTLVKRAPLPRSAVVGDLRDREKLAALLGTWGVEPKNAKKVN